MSRPLGDVPRYLNCARLNWFIALFLFGVVPMYFNCARLNWFIALILFLCLRLLEFTFWDIGNARTFLGLLFLNIDDALTGLDDPRFWCLPLLDDIGLGNLDFIDLGGVAALPLRRKNLILAYTTKKNQTNFVIHNYSHLFERVPPSRFGRRTDCALLYAFLVDIAIAKSSINR